MKRQRTFFYMMILLMACFFSSIYYTKAQSTKYNAHGWQLLDYRTDHVFGAGVNRAYNELLKGKKAYPVIVAVIDMGVDTAQEDLRGHIWINTREIPGNGIDDDHNGYVDDIHGWNFLGNSVGKNIDIESYESAREYYRLKNSHPNSGRESKIDDSLYSEKVKKYFSVNIYRPGKMGDEAIQYATGQDVLIVHAAGNEMVNLDSTDHFPSPNYENRSRNDCCFIAVGANAGGPDSLVLARFSNYGKTQVALFAPGVKVYSALPANQYAS